MKSFTDASTGISLVHPAAWQVASGGEGPIFVYVDPTGGSFRRNVNIMVQKGPQFSTLKEYTQISLDQEKSVKNFKQYEYEATTWDGSPAYRQVWQATMDIGASSANAMFLSEWTVRNNVAYLVTYTSDPGRFASARPNVERMIQTVHLPS